MRKLYIVRHAEAEKEHSPGGDFNRPLTGQGQRDAERIGDKLKERRITAHIMLSSLALRTLTTCTVFASRMGYESGKIHTDKRIYRASLDVLMQMISRLEDQYLSVILFGHNPGCSHLTSTLVNKQVYFPTCGIAAISLAITSWSDIEPGCGRMIFFVTPDTV